MASGSELVIRQVSIEDFSAVMDIDDNIYDGMDYLPILFKDMIRDENSYMLLAELGSKVVGFTNFMKVGPNAVVAMAARTRASFRGQGIASKLYKACIQHYMKIYGKPILEYRTAMLDDRLNERIKMNQNITCARYWNVVRYHFCLDISLETLDQDLGSCITEKARARDILVSDTLSKLQDILKSDGNLLPDHFSWMPRDINIENITNVIQNVDTVLLTKRQVDRSISAVSLVSSCQVKCGLVVDIWLYAKEYDVAICLAHLCWVLKSLKDKIHPEESIGLLIHFPWSVQIEDLVNRLRPVLGERYGLGSFQNTSAVAVIETHDNFPQ